MQAIHPNFLASALYWSLLRFVAVVLLLQSMGCIPPPGDQTRQNAQAPPNALFVATNGNDSWSGRLPAPNPGNTDGPFASVGKALESSRASRNGRQSEVTQKIWLRSG